MRYDVLPEESPPGRVSHIRGRPVRGGPLDHAGHLIADPAASPPELVGFVIEDKNVRSVLYPRAHEVWDLLVKAGDFPTHGPLLIAPNVHHTLWTFFKAIGAIGYASGFQWFAPSPAIPNPQFSQVVKQLSFTDARQLTNPDEASRAIRKFFTTTLRTAPKGEQQTLLTRSLDRWAIAAPVCAAHPELRDEDLDTEKRTETYQQVLEELDEAGVDVAELRAHHRHVEGDADHEAIDWHEVVDLDDVDGDERG